MVPLRSVVRYALAVLAPAAYYAVVVFILSRSTLEIYGFPVSPDLRTAVEGALEVCPMIAALFTILIASWRQGVIDRMARNRFSRFATGAHTPAALVISALVAILTALLTAAAIVTVCGVRWDGDLVTIVWLTFDFVVDLTLIGIFTIFLHALTHRAWLTFLLFIAYVAFVVIFGTRWQLTSFLGFASTVPVRLSGYSSLPLYAAAEWLFRAYWISVAVVLLVIMDHVLPSGKPMAVAMYGERSAAETRRWKRAVTGACAIYVVVAVSLFAVQQHALAKYRGVSPRRLDQIIAANSEDWRLYLDRYDLTLRYFPSRRTVDVIGVLHLETDSGGWMRVAYLQLPSVLTLQEVRIEGVTSPSVKRIGKYLRLEWPAPLRPHNGVRLRYSGTIHTAGPFDLTVEGKVLSAAFFLTDADLLISPRRPSCLISDPALLIKRGGSCQTENYALADMATGSVRISAPAGFVAVGPGVRRTAPQGESQFNVDKPQLNKFMVACARFATLIVPASNRLPVISVHRARPERTALADVARAAISFYQKEWPPYRRAELTIVETPAPLGEAVTFDGLVALSDRIVRSRDPRSQETSSLAQFVLAHEIAHQWWGYEVIPAKAPGELFVLESFAQFGAYKYLDHHGILGLDAARQAEAKWYRRAVTHLKKPEVALASLQENDLALAYHKGTLVLLSLDKMTGGTLMPIFGRLLRLFGKNGSPTIPPRQVIEGFVDQLPPSQRNVARDLLFSPPGEANRLLLR